MVRRKLGIVALLLGITALACAVLPALVFDEPPSQWPWTDRRENAEAPSMTEAAPEGDPAVSVKAKRFSFSFGRKKKKDAEAAATQPAVAPTLPAPVIPQPPVQPVSRSRPFVITSAGLALCGLFAGPFAWPYRRERPLAGAGMMFCCFALAWQYILAGIVIGVAVAILLIILSAVSN